MQSPESLPDPNFLETPEDIPALLVVPHHLGLGLGTSFPDFDSFRSDRLIHLFCLSWVSLYSLLHEDKFLGD